jgi:hypothetical protein
MPTKTDGIMNGIGCVLLTVIIVGYLAVGPICFSYDLDACFGVNAPLWLDIVGGWGLGSAAIPSAIVVGVVDLCGVEKPFFNKDKTK